MLQLVVELLLGELRQLLVAPLTLEIELHAGVGSHDEQHHGHAEDVALGGVDGGMLRCLKFGRGVLDVASILPLYGLLPAELKVFPLILLEFGLQYGENTDQHQRGKDIQMYSLPVDQHGCQRKVVDDE